MELLDLPQLAKRADLPVSLARYYRDRFILFVPTVRVGRTLLHPPEATAVLRLIADQARTGTDSGAIETALERAYPVTVITSQDVCGDGSIPGAAGVVNALASIIDERGARIESEVASLRAQLETNSEIERLRDAEAQSRSDIDALTSKTLAEVDLIKIGVEEIRSRQSTLASHDQLEWIGDSNGADANPADHDRGEAKGDSTKFRAPRRLGQLNKPQDFVIHDHGSAPGSE
jgi:hypothetical protein